MRAPRLGKRALASAALLLTGCTAVLGVNDVFYDATAATSRGDGGSETTDGAPTTGDGGQRPDGGELACDADLQSDPRHCGRCGHDCLGGDCTDGMCEPVTLADVARPAGIAVDDTNVYFNSLSTDTVFRVAKTGGAVETIATVKSAHGLHYMRSPRKLWLSGDATIASGGGLFVCDPPQCSDKKPVGALDEVRQIAGVGDTVFVASVDGVFRAKLDTTPALVNDAVGQPFDVAVDATHVYYTSLANSLYRAPLDGGAGEIVGPLTSNTNYSFIALDDTRVYWAFTDASSGKGQVLGALKSSPATRTSYTNAGAGASGVATDGTNVYWSEDGAFLGTTPVGDGTIAFCPVAGCPASGPTVLATEVRASGPLVLDEVAIYWIEWGTSQTDGRVRKVAKP